MTLYQREEAIATLDALTDVPRGEIEEYDDHELEQWLWELGYEWDETQPVGEWCKAVQP